MFKFVNDVHLIFLFMRLIAISYFAVAIIFSSCVLTGSTDQTGDWEILFDGNGMEKWRSKNREGFPAHGWKIEGDLLFLDGKGGDIITKEKYSDFELVFDFKLTEKANSGIKYFVTEITNRETGKSMINGPEYQIIDDFNNKSAMNDPLSSTASAYLLYAPATIKLNPHGNWNTGKIIAKGKKVEHWLNGKKVLNYARGSRDFLKRKALTKFKDDEHYGEADSGHIMLTDHNDRVYFRNIKIRKL